MQPNLIPTEHGIVFQLENSIALHFAGVEIPFPRWALYQIDEDDARLCVTSVFYCYLCDDIFRECYNCHLDECELLMDIFLEVDEDEFLDE
jgi:hypothetical protein